MICNKPMQRGRNCGLKHGHLTHCRSYQSVEINRKRPKSQKHEGSWGGQREQLPAEMVRDAGRAALLRYAKSGLFKPGDTLLPNLLEKP